MIPRIDSNELLEGIAQREEAALRYLYRHYRPAMYALALRIASWERRSGSDGGGVSGGVEGPSEPSEVEKAVRDVFVAAWEAAPSFDRSKADADTWLVTLGHRLLVRQARHYRRGAGKHTAESRSHLPPLASEFLQWTRSGSTVHTRLAGLDDDSRFLLAEAYFGGFTVEELAKLGNRSQRRIAQGLIRSVEWLRGRASSDAEGSPVPPSEGLPNLGLAPNPVEGSGDSLAIVDDASLLDFAFGTIGGDRAARIEAFLEENQAVGNRVRLFQDALAGLVMALEYPSAAAGSPTEAAEGDAPEENLVARLRHHRRPPLPLRTPGGGSGRRSQAWVGLGMAAALGLTVWLAMGPLSRADRIERRIERYQEQPGALSAPLHDREGNEFGTLVRLRNGRLFVAFEERPADNATYQLWELRGERIRSLGTADGRSILTPPVAAGALVSITLEPSGGSPEPSGEPLVELRL